MDIQDDLWQLTCIINVTGTIASDDHSCDSLRHHADRFFNLYWQLVLEASSAIIKSEYPQMTPDVHRCFYIDLDIRVG